MTFTNLKKFSLGLATLLFLALSFTACTTAEDNLKPTIETTLEKGLVVPADVFAEGEAFVSAHLDQADEATRAQYMNSYVVGKHLAANGQMAAALANLSGIENLADINPGDYLSERQVAELQAELATVVTSSNARECVPVCYWNGTRWVFAGYYMC